MPTWWRICCWAVSTLFSFGVRLLMNPMGMSSTEEAKSIIILQINIVGPFFFFLYIATALHPGGGGRRLLSSVKRKRATSHFLFLPSRELLLLPDSTRVYRFIFNELRSVCLFLLIVWLLLLLSSFLSSAMSASIPQFETRALNATAAWDSRRRRRGAIIKRRRPIKFFQTMM